MQVSTLDAGPNHQGPVDLEVIRVLLVRWRGLEICVKSFVRSGSGTPQQYTYSIQELVWSDFQRLRGAIDGLEKISEGLHAIVEAMWNETEPMRRNEHIVECSWESESPEIILGATKVHHVATPFNYASGGREFFRWILHCIGLIRKPCHNHRAHSLPHAWASLKNETAIFAYL